MKERNPGMDLQLPKETQEKLERRIKEELDKAFGIAQRNLEIVLGMNQEGGEWVAGQGFPLGVITALNAHFGLRGYTVEQHFNNKKAVLKIEKIVKE